MLVYLLFSLPRSGPLTLIYEVAFVAQSTTRTDHAAYGEQKTLFTFGANAIPTHLSPFAPPAVIEVVSIALVVGLITRTVAAWYLQPVGVVPASTAGKGSPAMVWARMDQWRS
jgi:hypothetical protein